MGGGGGGEGGVFAASEINAETLVVNINMTNIANTKSENSIQHTPHINATLGGPFDASVIPCPPSPTYPAHPHGPNTHP